ncbi:MAG: glycosyltransferase family 4 protein [Acidimicrobiales bacterium]
MPPVMSDRFDVVVDANVLGRQRTGDETYVRELLAGLGRDHHGLRVAALSRRPDLVPAGVSALPLTTRSQALAMAWSIPRGIRRLAPRLAHFQYLIPPGYRRPAAITVHDLSFLLLPELEDPLDGWVLRRLVPGALRRAALVLTVSERSRDDILEHYEVDPDRVVVTYNGVDDVFTPDGPRPQRPPYLLFVGALRPRKDPLGALEAFRRLGDDFELVMVGPDKGQLADVQRTIGALGLQERVAIVGHVDRDELVRLYRGAACLLFPSRYEGFGLPALEAMACGTPVVTTTAGSLPEIVGDAAVVVPPGDPEALAAGIATALSERDRLVPAGLARAATFTWTAMVEATAAAYRRVL